MNEKKIKEIVSFIASFLVERTGNDIFDKWREKRKIRKILDKDSENIKRVFYTVENSDLYNLIEEFIIFSAFKEPTFYSSMDLTEEQEDRLWYCFTDYIRRETGKEPFEVSSSYKYKIVKCVNLHNEAINNIIMDNKSEFQMKIMQKQHETIEKTLNRIIDTLNTDTKLQDKDDELNFVIEQLEAIIKSYRYDLNQLRKVQIMILGGTTSILLIMSIFIPLSLKYAISIYTTVIMLLFLGLVALYLLLLWKQVLSKERVLERDLNEMRGELWIIHFRLYENQITNKYTVHKK